MRILIVEDEEVLSAFLCKGLKQLGFAVDAAIDGEEALLAYRLGVYDLIILDLNLPKVSGIEVLRRIREKDRDIKILILSARSSVSDKVKGLDEGANDYLVKPFDFAELAARVRSLIHREFSQRPPILRVGDLTVNTLEKRAELHGVNLLLTPKEYGLLEYLVINRPRVVSAQELYEHVWDAGADSFSNVLQYHIHMLKKKLTAEKGQACLVTVRGHGYQIQEGDNEVKE